MVLPPLRRAVMRRFPYEVFYRDGDDILVVMVLHTAQSPDRVRQRLGRL